MTVVSRLRKDAHLRTLLPSARRGLNRRGRPRMYGKEWIDLAAGVEQHKRPAKTLTNSAAESRNEANSELPDSADESANRDSSREYARLPDGTSEEQPLVGCPMGDEGLEPPTSTV